LGPESITLTGAASYVTLDAAGDCLINVATYPGRFLIAVNNVLHVSYDDGFGLQFFGLARLRMPCGTNQINMDATGPIFVTANWATPSNWSGSPPADFQSALDRIADALFALIGPIP
jgi:hypothetical protein